MAIQKIMNSLIYGLSTDTKPITYATNTVWYEVDTGNIYVWSGSAWTLNDGASKTETLTNKTINASNNTITDTSAAVGDIMAISSGTSFKRLAMGTANQVLAVNSGGTALQWTTNTGGSGAPTSSAYVTIGNDATLTAERSLTVGNGIILTDGGANSTVTLDAMTVSILKNRIYYFEDNINSNSDFNVYGTSSGTGANFGIGTNVNTGAIGEAFVDPGTTATGSALSDTAVASIIPGLGILTLEMRIIVPVLSDGTNQFTVRVGLGDTSTSSSDMANGIYFEYNQATDTHWKMCTAAASTRTKTASTQLVTTSYARLKLIVNAAGNSITYYYNDTSLGTVSTNIPTSSHPMFIFFQIVKNLGTTSRPVYMDYVAFTIDMTTPR